jgi:hypothetical protein
MGYNIEVSFDILKNSSVTELQKTVKNYAEECGCELFYEDYEYETHSQFKRNHCVITIIFSQTNVEYLLLFLKFIKNKEGLFLELIYDDISKAILYASQYYVTQKMNKSYSKTFKQERRERSYSDDENMILNIVKKHKN